MNKKNFILSFLFISFFTYFWISGQKKNYKKTEINLDSFASIPAVYEGRIKPLDTIARNLLKIFSGKEKVLLNNQKIPAIQWYLYIISQSSQAYKIEHFRITNKDLIKFLSLTPKGQIKKEKVKKNFLYSFQDLQDKFESLDKIVANSQNKKQQNITLSPLEEQALSLRNNLNLFLSMIENHHVFFESQNISTVLQRRKFFDNLSEILIVPPISSQGKWLSLINGYLSFIASNIESSGIKINTKQQEIILLMRSLLASFLGYITVEESHKSLYINTFNKNVIKLHELLNQNRFSITKEIKDELISLKKRKEQSKLTSELTTLFIQIKEKLTQQELWEQRFSQVNFEKKFNQHDIFSLSIFFYILIIILTSISFLDFKHNTFFKDISIYLTILTFFLHTYGVIARIIISNYPPVTNLYSSAIFIGWVAIGILILIELINKIGVGALIASIIGIITLIIANYLSGDGDTLEMKQAVLDTRFWLTTHVITITIGYASNFILGSLGIIIVFYHGLKKNISLIISRKLMKSLYGILAFSILFSLLGTILGGLWADDSWGRFWGWDPKENGALMIVVWDVLLIHVMWGRLLKPYGIATLAVFSNVITVWSWFGTNQLGVGLHSYGFNESGRLWLLIFVLTQLLIIFFALIRYPKVSIKYS